MITLKSYQKECVDTIHNHFKKHSRQLLNTGVITKNPVQEFINKYLRSE